uniref:Uncharacterized protein n=2 Tax=Sulfobacillus thermotolerans TaxID=338644 RepID=G5CJ00_9FIRM|nr:hypothetical protein [Sulfobacillus thermotolerans]
MHTMLRARAAADGFAQTLLALGVFLILLALWGMWTNYTRVEQTRTTIHQVVLQGLASGLITPVSGGGGYETEPYGGTALPQWDLAGVIAQAARFAQATVPQSQAVPTDTGYHWTLSAEDQLRWDLAGPISVQDVTLSQHAPYEVSAVVSAPMRINLWGIAVLPATLHITVVEPFMGQQGPARFQSY